MSSYNPGGTQSLRNTKLIIGLCALLLVLLYLQDWLPFYLRFHSALFVDDAYYYFQVARNLVLTNTSTFDGYTLTNGYHPLWMGLIYLIYRFAAGSFFAIKALETIFMVVSLVAFLATLELEGIFYNVLFTFGFYWVSIQFAMLGMETSLYTCGAGLLTYSLFRRPQGSGGWHGVLAVLTIGARIDAVTLVLPQLLVSIKKRNALWTSLTICSVAGLCYVLFNQFHYGVLFPVSGEIKALGGLQINHPLLAQMRQNHDAGTRSFLLTVLLLLLAPLCLIFEKKAAIRSLLLSFLIGFPLFAIRLVFFSSWIIWRWYDYPLLIGYAAVFGAILRLIKARINLPAQGVISTLMIVTAAIVLFRHDFHPKKGSYASQERSSYYAVNYLAVQQLGPLFKGQRFAMGDRAGEIGYSFGNGLNQLEGIMNDKEYYEIMKKKGDVQQLLCRRDVHYIMSYEPDLGSYTSHQIDTVRPHLSQYPAPQLTVFASDQVGRVSDLAKFNSGTFGDADVYLYVWKLRCPNN